MTAGIVLAAGKSTRMGQNKLLMDIADESMVRRAVRTALAADLSPVVVVIGHEADRVKNELTGLPVEYVVNVSDEPTTASSMQVGLTALDAQAQAAVIILADMVLVTASMVRNLVDRMGATGKLAVASRYGEVIAPPMVFHRTLFDQLLSWRGPGAGKGVVAHNPNDAVLVDWPPDLLVDVDTPAGYESVRARLSESPEPPAAD